mmetsp:Transcript_7804/g.23824  ORF Transcript_7804/g.23824 Transcript_7804/m.23824 type:complete len:284 (+) Transcript_7804:244-1095(+)
MTTKIALHHHDINKYPHVRFPEYHHVLATDFPHKGVVAVLPRAGFREHDRLADEERGVVRRGVGPGDGDVVRGDGGLVVGVGGRSSSESDEGPLHGVHRIFFGFVVVDSEIGRRGADQQRGLRRRPRPAPRRRCLVRGHDDADVGRRGGLRARRRVFDSVERVAYLVELLCGVFGLLGDARPGCFQDRRVRPGSFDVRSMVRLVAQASRHAEHRVRVGLDGFDDLRLCGRPRCKYCLHERTAARAARIGLAGGSFQRCSFRRCSFRRCKYCLHERAAARSARL